MGKRTPVIHLRHIRGLTDGTDMPPRAPARCGAIDEPDTHDWRKTTCGDCAALQLADVLMQGRGDA